MIVRDFKGKMFGRKLNLIIILQDLEIIWKKVLIITNFKELLLRIFKCFKIKIGKLLMNF